MPTTPFAIAQMSVNGGAPQQGGITVAGASTIQLSGTNTSNWGPARWEIYAYPNGWPTPAGWTLDANTGIIYSTDTTPSLITLEAASTRWGKWLVRLIVNGGTKSGVPPVFDPTTGSYLPNDVIDIASGWEVVDPALGLHEPALYEGTQFGGLRRWIDSLQKNTRAISAAFSPSKIGVVNFVTDCGADPTGVADCAAAINAAGVLLTSLAADSKRSIASCKLYVPPGRYSVRSATNIIDFNSKMTSVEIFGSGDASIFEVGVGAGNWLFALENVFRAHVHDLAFVGTKTDPTPDASFVLYFLARHSAIVERCHFEWLLCDTAVIFGSGTNIRMLHTSFGGCAATPSTSGVVHVSQAPLYADDCFFSDIPTLNGYTLPSTKAAYATKWIRVDDSFSIISGASNVFTHIKNCYFDESAQCAVFIKGGPTANIPMVKIEGCSGNPGGIPGSIGMLHVENVTRLNVDGWVDSGFNASTSAAVELVAVTTAHLRGIVVTAASTSNYITADSACGVVEVEDSPTLSTTTIQSSATRTTVRSGDTYTVQAPRSDIAPTDTVYTPQGAYASAATNLIAANFVVNIPASIGAGVKYGGIEAWYNGGRWASLGTYANGAAGALYLGVIPGAANFTILGDGTNTVFNAPGAGFLSFRQQNTEYLQLATHGLQLSAAAPTIAATGNTTLSSAQYANGIIKLGTVSLSGNVTVTFPNAAGMWFVDCSGITLNGHTLQFVSGSSTSAAFTPSTTNQLAIVTTYGGNTITIK